jgi:transketolase
MKEEQIIANLRKKTFLTAYSAPIAHIASAFSIVEILYVLYNHKILKYDSSNPKLEHRDLFILSKGHGSAALYTILSSVGFFDDEILKSFAKPNSILGGEPCIPLIPGIEATTGSLGHGLSLGVGMALVKKIDKTDEKVYVLLGDGECEEGTIWEAVMFANHQKLNNLIAIVDCNKVQKMGSLEGIMGIDSWKSRFESFGWIVEEVDGHDINALDKVFKKENNTERPKVILANTVKGKGVSLMEGNPKWHWRLPNRRELKVFIEELNISEEEILQCKKPI